MIQLGSVSYPYLAIAKHFGVPYRVVLAFVEQLPDLPDYIMAWQIETRLAYLREQQRRAKA